MTDHATMVSNLAKPGEEISAEMTPENAHMIHMVLGICGEAGELLDAVKKAVIYQKPLDMENIIEELGDIEFYMEGFRQGIDVTRDETLHANVEKLSRRYPDLAYTNEAAQTRADKSANHS